MREPEVEACNRLEPVFNNAFWAKIKFQVVVERTSCVMASGGAVGPASPLEHYELSRHPLKCTQLDSGGVDFVFLASVKCDPYSLLTPVFPNPLRFQP